MSINVKKIFLNNLKEVFFRLSLFYLITTLVLYGLWLQIEGPFSIIGIFYFIYIIPGYFLMAIIGAIVAYSKKTSFIDFRNKYKILRIGEVVVVLSIFYMLATMVVPHLIHGIAVRTNIIYLCKGSYNQDFCTKEVAVQSIDLSLCPSKETYEGQACIERLSIKMNDSSICEQAMTNSDVESCYYMYAINTLDEDVCNRFDDNPDVSVEACLSNIEFNRNK